MDDMSPVMKVHRFIFIIWFYFMVFFYKANIYLVN